MFSCLVDALLHMDPGSQDRERSIAGIIDGYKGNPKRFTDSRQYLTAYLVGKRLRA